MKKNIFFWIIMSFVISFWGCKTDSESGSRQSTTSVMVRGAYKSVSNLSGQNFNISAITGLDEIARITVSVLHGSTEIINDQELLNNMGTWEATLDDLPTATMLSFEAKAYDASDDVVLTGSTLKTLVGDGSDVITVSLGENITVDQVSVQAVRFPIEIQVLETHEIQFDLAVIENIQIDYQFIAETDGGLFDTIAGTYVPSATGIATLAVNYTAPAIDGDYRHTISMSYSGNRTTKTYFTTTVSSEVNQSGFAVVFNPFLIHLNDGPGDGSVVPFAATAGDDKPVEELFYLWTFDSGGLFPSVTFEDSTSDQATLINYDENITGTVTLNITDGDGGSTVFTIPVIEGQYKDFSNDPVPKAVAIAGNDQIVDVGTLVDLDGSASTTNAGPLSYTWTITISPAGSTATLSSTNSATTSFTPDIAGNYTIQLDVTNGEDNDNTNVQVTANAVLAKPTLELENTGGTTYRLNLLSPVEYQDNRLIAISGIDVFCPGIGDNTASIVMYHDYPFESIAFGDNAVLKTTESVSQEKVPVGGSFDILSLPCDSPPQFNLDADSTIGYSGEPSISGPENIDVINP